MDEQHWEPNHSNANISHTQPGQRPSLTQRDHCLQLQEIHSPFLLLVASPFQLPGHPSSLPLQVLTAPITTGLRHRSPNQRWPILDEYKTNQCQGQWLMGRTIWYLPWTPHHLFPHLGLKSQHSIPQLAVHSLITHLSYLFEDNCPKLFIRFWSS